MSMNIMDFYGGDTNTLSYLRPTGNMDGNTISTIMDKMMENLQTNEITITFKQVWRNNYTNDELIHLMKEYIRKNTNMLDIQETILLTEYGNNNNLHFHGLIRSTHKNLSTLKGFLNKRFGRTTISYIKYPKSYKRYLMKEQTVETLQDVVYCYLPELNN